MTFTAEQAAVLERTLRRLFVILDQREGLPTSNPRRRVGILLSHFSTTLIEVNALSEVATQLATDAGVRSIIQSLSIGWYGPLRIPAFEFEDAVQITDRVSDFALWRAAMEQLILDANVVATGDRSRHRPVSSVTRYESSAPPVTPGHTDESASEPDGPAEPFRFRWRGRSVDFMDANLRYRLVVALWDRTAGKPHPARAITDVMVDVYGDDINRDGAFKNLCTKLRSEFQKAEKTGLSITVKTSAGKIWLSPSPN